MFVLIWIELILFHYENGIGKSSDYKAEKKDHGDEPA